LQILEKLFEIWYNYLNTYSAYRISKQGEFSNEMNAIAKAIDNGLKV